MSWTPPWKYKEGFAICAGLALVGLALQLSAGPINWDLFAAPVNAIFLVAYLALIVVAYGLRKRTYVIRWAMTCTAAVPAILTAGAATVIYGITCDRSTLSAWPFVLLYFWLTTILGLTTLNYIFRPAKSFKNVERWNVVFGKKLPFLVNHAGLFIAIVAATLGSADMQRLRMTIRQDSPEWRAMDEAGNIRELDIAIVLNHFAIEEYPPKLVVIDNETGRALPDEAPASLVLEDSIMRGEIMGHRIEVTKVYPYCALFADSVSVNYVPWMYSGATTAALVSIDGRPAEWISNGSYMFPYRPIRIDDKTSLVMPECDPKRYTSNVNAYAKSGEVHKDVDIEVNHPFELEGWKIYQLSYDETQGRWSKTSVVELVRDPWLPAVYVGIFMLLAGALFMFITAGGKKL